MANQINRHPNKMQQQQNLLIEMVCFCLVKSKSTFKAQIIKFHNIFCDIRHFENSSTWLKVRRKRESREYKRTRIRQRSHHNHQLHVKQKINENRWNIEWIFVVLSWVRKYVFEFSLRILFRKKEEENEVCGCEWMKELCVCVCERESISLPHSFSTNFSACCFFTGSSRYLLLSDFVIWKFSLSSKQSFMSYLVLVDCSGLPVSRNFSR